jgi:hypothetical protein
MNSHVENVCMYLLSCSRNRVDKSVYQNYIHQTTFSLRPMFNLYTLEMNSSKKSCPIGFENLTAVVMKSSVFRDIMMFSPLKVNWHFGGTCHHNKLRRLVWVIVICTLLCLLVIPSCKCAINLITNPNPVYSHLTRDNIIASVNLLYIRIISILFELIWQFLICLYFFV